MRPNFEKNLSQKGSSGVAQSEDSEFKPHTAKKKKKKEKERRKGEKWQLLRKKHGPRGSGSCL
jgi:hypothetical protein